jgi:hypothetical protein
MPAYDSVTGVMSAACDLQDALGFIGETEAAEELDKALHAPFGTSTAALEDVARALTAVRPTVRRTLDEAALQSLDACIVSARALALPPDRLPLWNALAALIRKKK